MARILTSGFEINSVTGGIEFTTIAGTVSSSTSTVRSGSRSARINPTAGTGQYINQQSAALQSRPIFARVYMNIATAPSTSNIVLSIATGSNVSTGSINLTGGASPVLQLLKADGTQIGSNTATLSTGVWYRLELMNDSTNNPGTLTALLNGVQFASGLNSSQGTWRRVMIGPNANTTCNLFFDDWAVNDATGSSQTSWPGDGTVLTSWASAAGDSAQWTETPITTSNYDKTSENPPDDATTNVHSLTANQVDLYNFTDFGISAGNVISVVHLTGRSTDLVSADATTAVTYRIIKTSGGTASDSAPFKPNSTSYITGQAPSVSILHNITLYNDPDGLPWTPTTVNSIQGGVVLSTANVSAISITNIWITVEYSLASVGELALVGVG